MSEVTTTLICDGHLHLYPEYRWQAALIHLASGLQQLQAAAGSVHCIGFLAESARCRFYQQALGDPAAFRADGISIAAGPEADALVVRSNGAIAGHLVAGRQIVTRERLEVLALTRDLDVPDGLPVHEVLAEIKRQGAVAVLSWSPGKWFFGRGKIVQDLIDASPPDAFLLGDTSLRPTCWPMPALLRKAAQRGFKIIAGSDPLPLAGEERFVGTYGFTCQAPFDPDQPAASLRRMLSGRSFAPRLVGRRSGALQFLARWGRNRVKKG